MSTITISQWMRQKPRYYTETVSREQYETLRRSYRMIMRAYGSLAAYNADNPGKNVVDLFSKALGIRSTAISPIIDGQV